MKSKKFRKGKGGPASHAGGPVTLSKKVERKKRDIKARKDSTIRIAVQFGKKRHE